MLFPPDSVYVHRNNILNFLNKKNNLSDDFECDRH